MARLVSAAIARAGTGRASRRTTQCRYTTNPKTVARVSASKVVTDTTGANCFADATEARLLTRMSREKTKVARNKPSVRRETGNE